MKKISKEFGENMSDEELKIMLERASKNGVELTSRYATLLLSLADGY